MSFLPKKVQFHGLLPGDGLARHTRVDAQRGGDAFHQVPVDLLPFVNIPPESIYRVPFFAVAHPQPTLDLHRNRKDYFFLLSGTPLVRNDALDALQLHVQHLGVAIRVLNQIHAPVRRLEGQIFFAFFVRAFDILLDRSDAHFIVEKEAVFDLDGGPGPAIYSGVIGDAGPRRFIRAPRAQGHLGLVLGIRKRALDELLEALTVEDFEQGVLSLRVTVRFGE